MEAYGDSSALVESFVDLHAVAAEKSGAEQLLTTDENDFESLSDHLRVEQV